MPKTAPAEEQPPVQLTPWTCTDCGQTGTDPRHGTVQLGPDGEHFETAHHHDCGSRRDPQCAACVEVLAQRGVTNGETGAELRALLDIDEPITWES